VAPLLDQVNEFLAIAAPGRTAYCELVDAKGKPIFELGWKTEDVRVSLPALSGGEAAMFCAGLALALVKLADPPLKLLLLEAGPLDSGNLASLLRAIEATANDVQAVVATHIGFPEVNGGWKVIKL